MGVPRDLLCARSLATLPWLLSWLSWVLLASCLFADSNRSVQNNQTQLRFKYRILAGGSGKSLVSHGNSQGTQSTHRDGDTRGSLTFQVPVEILEPSHLTISLVPHGFLQGFPLGRRLDEVFVILRDALDLALQLGWRKGQARVRYSWNEEKKGRCRPKLGWGAQPNLSCQRSSVHPKLTPSTCFGGGN